MTTSFRGMKKRRTNFEELEKKFETKRASNDDRFYYPERTAEGNGFAELRFLPTGLDTLPFARYNEHWFKGPGGWFKNNCRNDLDDDQCPVCDVNRELVEKYGKWEAVPESVKSVVRDRKRGLKFVANVYVVTDPANPENQGKVMLFRFGAKIMDMIKAALQKDELDPDSKQFDPFNPWEGANFKFKIKKVKGQTNYDTSVWADPTPLLDGDDDAIDLLAAQVNDLSEWSPDKAGFYTDYETQLKHLNRVLGSTPTTGTSAAHVADVPNVGKTEEAEDPADDSENLDDLAKMFDQSDDDEDIPF